MWYNGLSLTKWGGKAMYDLTGVDLIGFAETMVVSISAVVLLVAIVLELRWRMKNTGDET
jgi:hypothetical protein